MLAGLFLSLHLYLGGGFVCIYECTFNYNSNKNLTLYLTTEFIIRSGGEDMDGLTIGQVAKGANVNVETVRYYERVGLIPLPPRTESKYRLFPAEVIQRIKFIKKAQDLGFTLSEIKTLLSIYDSKNFDCKEVQQFASQKIEEIELKIKDLQDIKSILQDLTNRCPGQGSIGECPIINEFEEGGDSDGKKTR